MSSLVQKILRRPINSIVNLVKQCRIYAPIIINERTIANCAVNTIDNQRQICNNNTHFQYKI